MAQPHCSAALSSDTGELAEDLLSRTKPRTDFLVGVEFEFFGIERETRRPLAYHGASGIASLFGLLVEQGWTPEVEDGRAIALEKHGAHLTLEPGGQVELSGDAHPELEGVHAELRQVAGELIAAGDQLGLAFYQAGRQPFYRHEEVPWVPKGRYGVMKPYLARTGARAHVMMKETSGIQVNVDVRDEADMMRKLRLSTAIAPLTSAMFANSAIREGGRSEWVCERLDIWKHTDPARCGLIGPALDPGFTAQGYVEYALDVPMMFLYRDGEWVAMQGKPFREYLANGHEGYQATWADWQLHLSGIFTEVRVKGYVEVRSMDAVPWPLSMAVPALWKGLLYDDAALDRLDALTEGWGYDELVALTDAVAQKGLLAPWRGGDLRPLALQVVELAQAGLPEGERKWLEPLAELAARGESPAGAMVRGWESEGWGTDLDAFLASNGLARILD